MRHWFVGIAAEYELREGLVLCGEIHHDFGVRGSSSDTLFNLGLKWAFTEHASFIGSVGRSFDPTPDAGSDLIAYLGMQWSF